MCYSPWGGKRAGHNILTKQKHDNIRDCSENSLECNSLPWPQVQSLVGELRSHKPHGVAKKKKKKDPESSLTPFSKLGHSEKISMEEWIFTTHLLEPSP